MKRSPAVRSRILSARPVPLVTDVTLFDVYRGKNVGEGKKSMAFSLVLADPNGEVQPEQVEHAVKKILGNLKYKLNIEIR